MKFQTLLTEIASQKPDVVFAFLADGGAPKFLKDYAAAGRKKSIPLVASGFVTDGTLEAAGQSGQGVLSRLHCADNLDTPRNNAFRTGYALAYKANADVYAVHGYDAAQLMAAGLDAVKGDMAKRDALYAVMGKAVVDRPRGKFSLSPQRNPVQDIYLCEGKGANNESRGVAVKSLADPGRGCKV